MMRIPGGLMLFPLLVGALIRTIFPGLFSITAFTSSFTGGLFTGILPLLAAFYVCLGSTIQFKSTGLIVKKGLALWAGKIITAFLIALLIKSIFPDQNNMFLGLSALAIISAFTDTNGGLYMALLGQISNKSEDVAAYSIMSVESGPFFTMLILGLTGLAQFPLLSFLFALLPLIMGIILGNIDKDMRTFLSKGVDVLIPMFALALGCTINLIDVVKSGFSGILLGIAVVVITGVILYFLDKLTGGNGVAGVAASSTAGNAAAVPVAVAAVFAGYKAIAATATLQVTAAVIVTAILTPIWTSWLAKRVKQKTSMKQASESM